MKKILIISCLISSLLLLAGCMGDSPFMGTYLTDTGEIIVFMPYNKVVFKDYLTQKTNYEGKYQYDDTFLTLNGNTSYRYDFMGNDLYLYDAETDELVDVYYGEGAVQDELAVGLYNMRP